MNWQHFQKNIGRRFQLEPIATFLDDSDNETSELNDNWEIIEIDDSKTIKLRNLRTSHEVLLGKDHIYDFQTNPHRNDGDLESGFLVLKVHILIKNNKVSLRANSRPGERVIPYPKKRSRPIWTEFIKVDAQSAVPPTAKTAKIQFKLWSENESIPLMIRIASDVKGKSAQEVSGPSGIVNLLLRGTQDFYISLSNPNLHYEIGIVGWSF